MMRWLPGGVAAAIGLLAFYAAVLPVTTDEARAQGALRWQREFPKTDFEKRSIDLSEVGDDGNTRDSIPPVYEPRYVSATAAGDIGPLEPVLSVVINGDARAYPLRILLWHEIVNEVIGGVPVLISYCPLCNSGVVFDRRVDGRTLVFGNTGRLRHRDMVMYDTETESWWQQFTGEALIGDLTGKRMTPLPARLESLARFHERAPDGQVLIPEDSRARPYGATPYAGMDTAILPLSVQRLHFPYDLPNGVGPLSRVVVIGAEAWTLDRLRANQRVEAGGLVLTWVPGQNSIHDKQRIARGRDVGNVVVQRDGPAGLQDVAYDVTFAFAFRAFNPEGVLNQ